MSLKKQQEQNPFNGLQSQPNKTNEFHPSHNQQCVCFYAVCVACAAVVAGTFGYIRFFFLFRNVYSYYLLFSLAVQHNRWRVRAFTVKILAAITTRFAATVFPSVAKRWWLQFTQRVSNACVYLCLALALDLVSRCPFSRKAKRTHDAFQAIESSVVWLCFQFVFIHSFTSVPFFLLSLDVFRSLSLSLSLSVARFFCPFFRHDIYFPQLYYFRHLSTFHNTLPKMRSTS